MPQPLPAVIKSHKSVFVDAGRAGMNSTGVQAILGDYITILAKGTIDLSPAFRGAYAWGPKVLLSYKLSKEGSVQRYQGPEIIAITESGTIYLSYDPDLSTYWLQSASPIASAHTGFFYVDIIVWNTNDTSLMARFLAEASSAQSKDKDLREMAQEFKKRQEVSLALQKKPEGAGEVKKAEVKVGEAKPAIAPPMKEQLPETKKPEREKQIPEQKVVKKVEQKQVPPAGQKPPEEKKIITPSKEKEIPEIREDEKEKRLQELGEKLKKALQAVKELEEMKEVLARLESMEIEKSKQPKNLPVIAIAYPKDGISVDSEYVNLYGVAEHDTGIQKFEILLNNKPVGSRGPQMVPKDR